MKIQSVSKIWHPSRGHFISSLWIETGCTLTIVHAWWCDGYPISWLIGGPHTCTKQKFYALLMCHKVNKRDGTVLWSEATTIKNKFWKNFTQNLFFLLFFRIMQFSAIFGLWVKFSAVSNWPLDGKNGLLTNALAMELTKEKDTNFVIIT